MSGGSIRLASGPLSAVLSDGDLFDVRWHGVETVQRLYVAVRDVAWNTIPAHLSSPVVRASGDGITAEFHARHRYREMDFRWRALVHLSERGLLTFEMDGAALQSFEYCKIGFNVHHGIAAHAGRPFRCRTLSGTHLGTFAADLAPQLVRDGTLTAMTPHFDRLEISLDGAELVFDFAGDRFEMQDHRNWADGNWKTYGTPLEAGFPHSAEAGMRIHQIIRLQIAGGIGSPRDIASPAGAATPASAVNRLRWHRSVDGGLPAIGHLLREIPSPTQCQQLARLHPSHIRVDLHVTDDYRRVWREAVSVADELSTALEVAMFLRHESPADDARQLCDVLSEGLAPLARVLVFTESSGFSPFRGACPPQFGGAVQAALAECGLAAVPVVSGTTQFFVDINRDRPDYSGLSGIVFAVNPQVHACDTSSMMRSPRALIDIADFCRQLYPGLNICLSPLDLIGNEGPFPAGPLSADGTPPQVDPRLHTDIGAAWTLAALSALVAGNVSAITLFELVGSRGLVGGSPAVSPVYTLLSRIATMDLPVRQLAADDPDRLAGIGFASDTGSIVVIANLTDEETATELPDGSPLTLDAYETRWITLTG
ncbi:MAG: hypothetical protein KGP10_04530 [Actinomycetales bacterium]|nr:hypothetical protein [Actinomycetales bacterium]